MHKPSPSRMSLIAGMAAALGMMAAPGIHEPSTAQVFKKQRGPAPRGMRWISTSVYIPGGDSCNVEGTIVRNPKIGAQMNAMHDAWYQKKFGAPA